MAHEYAKDAKASHNRKLKSYGAKDSETTPKNWAGFEALNTDRQAGRAPLNSEKYEAPEVRVQKKKGGAVSGAQSLKRLDKAPRKGKPVPSGTLSQEKFDKTTKFEKGEMAPRTMREDGGLAETEAPMLTSSAPMTVSAARGSVRRPGTDHRPGGGSRFFNRERGEHEGMMRPGLRGRGPGRAKGGEVHDDEAMDRKLVKKMVAKEALTGKCGGGAMKTGGRAKRASGGMLGLGDESGSSDGKKTPTKGKTTVNVMIGLPSAGVGAPPPGGAPPMANMPPPGAAPPIPPPPPPQMPPQGAAPMAPPPMDMGGGAPPPQMPPPQDMGGMVPMPRKDGGKVQVPYKKPGRKDDYPAMDFGSGGGFGRKQKIDAYGTKGPNSKNNY